MRKRETLLNETNLTKKMIYDVGYLIMYYIQLYSYFDELKSNEEIRLMKHKLIILIDDLADTLEDLGVEVNEDFMDFLADEFVEEDEEREEC